MFAMVGVSGGNGITVDVVDSAAPVVVSGTLVPSSSQPAGRNSDTLIVQFSEATIIPDNTTAFQFVTPGGASYQPELSLISTNGVSATFLVRSLSGTEAMRSGDSLWINVLASVCDSDGIVQVNPENRRAPLLVGKRGIQRSCFHDAKQPPAQVNRTFGIGQSDSPHQKNYRDRASRGLKKR